MMVMVNRLAQETSPYLLQHQENPVDWYPWGAEALARARTLDRPILLSIGYAACHWCHVMAHESFENPSIAAVINDHFVPIKVDREERPDLDALYMAAVQRLTGQGGWPLTVFLLPDGRPFYGGTYFPPVDRHGLPGFPRVLQAIADLYRQRREEVLDQAAQLTKVLAELPPAGGAEDLDPALLARAATTVRSSFDAEQGGFGGAPKFPQPMLLEFLLRAWRHGDPHALPMVELTLTKMARGGIYDHLGGGFHRYSVDDHWLVPHFEKMLYDNAQLARIYLDAFRATGQPLYRRVAEETLAYVQREMTAPEGGFYATQDADSEGAEGTFFLWTPEQIRSVLGTDAEIFMEAYDVTAGGNFEGKNILYRAQDPATLATAHGMPEEALESLLARCRTLLFRARERRIKPGRDEKILTAWNGLMLRAFATAAATLGTPSYFDTAQRCADFLLTTVQHEGRLRHTYTRGRAAVNGYLEDYAFLADGLLALYEAGDGVTRLAQARALADTMLAHFADPQGSLFFHTSDDHEPLIARPRDPYDNAVPAGNSVAVEVLLRLAVHTGEEEYRRQALRVLTALQDAMATYPQAFARLLCAADFALDAPRELVIVGMPGSEDTADLQRCAARRFDPNLVVTVTTPAMAAASDLPLLQGRTLLDAHATAYFCEHYVCRTPVNDPSALDALLR
jgi:uncharacterized protein YyaL (SSP411 family)